MCTTGELTLWCRRCTVRSAQPDAHVLRLLPDKTTLYYETCTKFVRKPYTARSECCIVPACSYCWGCSPARMFLKIQQPEASSRARMIGNRKGSQHLFQLCSLSSGVHQQYPRCDQSMRAGWTTCGSAPYSRVWKAVKPAQGYTLD